MKTPEELDAEFVQAVEDLLERQLYPWQKDLLRLIRRGRGKLKFNPSGNGWTVEL